MTRRPETGSSLRVFSRDAQWTGLQPPFLSRYFRPLGGVGRMIGAVAALVLLTLVLPGVAAATDRDALMALYNATNGLSWDDDMHWGDSMQDIGNWYGVTTNIAGRVTKLDLSNNALIGEIPEELGDLAALRKLNLRSNALTGEIPEELGQLVALRELVLNDNELEGSIPAALGSLGELRYLWLKNNKLDGSIPEKLGELRNLIQLDLLSNDLSGSIPEKLGELRNLEWLSLDGNALTGGIPEKLGELDNLIHLFLDGNALTGGIPMELGSLINLKWLTLHNNKLTGMIPPALGSLSNLTHLYLYNNKLSGSIPAALGNLSNLEDLKLHSNAALSGPLPDTFRDLTDLTELQIQNTQVTVPTDPAFTAWLETITFSYDDRTSTDSIALARDNTAPRGLWSDGTTLWVADASDARLYAYTLAGGSRQASKDIILADNTGPYGLWSDDTTLWVTARGAARLYAYRLDDGTPDVPKDILLAATNTDATGLWSDGTTLWVTNDTLGVAGLYAYTLAGGSRQASITPDIGNTDPFGLWSDGTTLWVADLSDALLYAYELATGARDKDKDAILAPANLAPTGIWSDGTTWWVVDNDEDRLYRYGSRFTRPPPPPPGRGGGGGGTASRDDHGNSPAQATEVTPGASAPWGSSTAGQISPANDVDYFTLIVPQAGVLVVETSGFTDTVGTVWQAGEELGMADSGGERRNFRLAVPVAAGPVVIAVAGTGRRTGAYTLRTQLLVGYLENPGPDSFQSGVGVLSGWVCAADTVKIELNGAVQAAAYGTERLDTADICGDTDNGFGLLFNWNLLRDGEHEVVAFVDGIELDRVTVTVTTLGSEFLRDVEGSCTVPDFPSVGETVTVEWQESKQNFVIASGVAPTGENRAGATDVGYLENPSSNSFQSGIGVLSGWVCAAEEVVIAIGHLAPQVAGYGTERLDTQDACGDTDNGFGLLFNWNLLGDGVHEVVAYVDDEELGRATVRVTTLGTEFLRGVEGECAVEDFPLPGETVTLAWQQNQQNFVVTAVE